MSEVTVQAPVQAAQAPAKKAAPKKPRAPGAVKPKSNNPTYLQMIVAAIRALKEVRGSSRPAILKYIIANYKLDPKLASSRAALAFKAALASGALKHGKTNATFKVGEKLVEQEKSKVKKEKARVKAAAAKVKAAAKKAAKKAAAKPKVKKTSAKKESVAKKSPTKKSCCTKKTKSNKAKNCCPKK
jgi:histone H1/5